MKKVICVCDREPEYAYSLMEAVNRHHTLPFEMKAFTDPEHLLRYLSEQEAEVLLISPAFYSREIRACEVPHVFFLSDSGRAPSEWSLPQISKYQRVDRIMQIIMEKVEPNQETEIGERTKFIGIYSPLHRVGRTTFALALCREINRERKALYINLEDMSGFEELFAQEYEADLTDLLYYARQSPEKFAMYLSIVTREYQEIDFVPPARVPLELKMVQLEEWQEFLELLRDSGVYDAVILDLGDSIQGLPDILTQMDRIYMPVMPDPISSGKIRQYETMMEIMDYQEILAHTTKLSLPQSEMVRESSGYTHDLLWGPMSGYARELIAERGEDF